MTALSKSTVKDPDHWKSPIKNTSSKDLISRISIKLKTPRSLECMSQFRRDPSLEEEVKAIISPLELIGTVYNYESLTRTISQLAILLQLPYTRKRVPVFSSTGMRGSLPEDPSSSNYGKCGNDVT